jgi:hypothetical protein
VLKRCLWLTVLLLNGFEVCQKMAISKTLMIKKYSAIYGDVFIELQTIQHFECPFVLYIFSYGVCQIFSEIKKWWGRKVQMEFSSYPKSG